MHFKIFFMVGRYLSKFLMQIRCFKVFVFEMWPLITLTLALAKTETSKDFDAWQMKNLSLCIWKYFLR